MNDAATETMPSVGRWADCKVLERRGIDALLDALICELLDEFDDDLPPGWRQTYGFHVPAIVADNLHGCRNPHRGIEVVSTGDRGVEGDKRFIQLAPKDE